MARMLDLADILELIIDFTFHGISETLFSQGS
jgi:hypothetical protein